MKLFVISLPHATARRRSAEFQLRAAGIPFEFSDAVCGRALVSRDGFEGCDRERWLINTGREITPGEVGCFASHRRLWQQCVERREPVMIMEDDFLILPRFGAAVDQASAHIDSCGHIRLQDERRARKLAQGACGDFTLARYTKAPHCTMCYALSPAVASSFLNASKIIDAPVDVFIKKFWEHGHALYCLTPYTVVDSHLSTETCIANRHKRRKDPVTSMRRFATKCGWQVGRLRFNLFFPENNHRAV